MSLWASFLDLGEVILLDQRGCGRSRPNLARRVSKQPPLDGFVDVRQFEKYLAETGREVRAELVAEGVDLTGYDTEQSADDIADLLNALGTDRGRIIGFSYGTHLGISVLRRHGDRIASAVLIGTEGPDETVKLPSAYDTHFRKLAAMVAADPAVSEKVPDLIALYQSVLERLEREPMLVKLEVAGEDAEVEVPIGPFGLQFILVRDIGDTNDLPVFPRLLYSIEQGDPSLLQWFVRKRYGLRAYPTLTFTMDYASGCPPERLERIQVQAKTSLLGNVMNAFWMPAVHEVWRMPVLSDAFRAPLVSGVRTLFLSGTLDANTPPYQAERMRWGMRNAIHLVQHDGGHEDWFRNPKALAVIHDFLAGEEVSGRDVDMPPLRFIPVMGPAGELTHPSLAE
jgi:pimeloyl-ACP methyl ester carboxylesterase